MADHVEEHLFTEAWKDALQECNRKDVSIYIPIQQTHNYWQLSVKYNEHFLQVICWANYTANHAFYCNVS